MKRLNVLFVAFSALSVSVSLADTEEEIPEGQISDGVELPVWQAEYSEGHFDTRLWPDTILEKVEIDHLRFLASAPDIDPEDREMYLEVVHDWEATHTTDGQSLSMNVPVPSS